MIFVEGKQLFQDASSSQVNTISGAVVPASFDKSAKCPDEVVRRVRISVSSENPIWQGRLLEAYDTRSDRFIIAPCKWVFNYLLNNPNWKKTFPNGQPRMFTRTSSGGWVQTSC